MKKIRNILTLALSGLFLAGFLLAAILTPDRTDSLSERRKLAPAPGAARLGGGGRDVYDRLRKVSPGAAPTAGQLARSRRFSGDILRASSAIKRGCMHNRRAICRSSTIR